MNCRGDLTKNVSFLPVDDKPKQNSGLDVELIEENQRVTDSFSPSALQVESLVQSQKQEKHATLRRSRSDIIYCFEVQRNSDLTEETPNVIVSFPPTTLETEASFRSQKRGKHATLRRTKSNANYGHRVQRSSDSTEGNQKAMENFSSTALKVESSVGSQKRENHAAPRRSKSDTSYGFEVKGDSGLTKGNQKVMASFSPTALESEESFRSQTREKHAALQRSRSNASYRFGVQRNSDSTEGNKKAIENLSLTLLRVESSDGSQKQEKHESLRRSRSDTSYHFEVQRDPDSTKAISPAALQVESPVRFHIREKHATLRRTRSDTSSSFEVQRNSDLTERVQKAMGSFPPTSFEADASFRPQKREIHPLLRRSRSNAHYGYDVQRNSNSTEGNQKPMRSLSPATLQVKSSVRSQKQE